MARYKHIDTSPRFLAVDLARQLLPGTFEHALNHLLGHEIDLSGFDARFCNDETGATAYPPALLLKVVLFAYLQGIVSSRGIERVCRDHVTFVALCGDSGPHCTTIANFVSTLGEDIAHVFAAVLAICDRQGLLGREMFAIDGVKLPSNAAKSRSGTRADFERQAVKLEAAAQTMLQRHREMDALPIEPTLAAKEGQRVERLQRDAAQLRAWLTIHPDDRHGPQGALRKSNRTDQDSAKMATGKGVIRGYTGVAAVDAQHPIIVCAQAHGTGSEQEVLLPVVAELKPILAADSLLTADAGYHSEANLQQLAACQIDALIADNGMRARDDRPIAVCLEIGKGPLVYALQQYHFLVLFPVNPATLAKYRQAFTPSRAKDDPTDAELALEALRCHRDKLRCLKPESAAMRTLQQLVEQRRALVGDKVRISNRVTYALKQYFPQALDWFQDIDTVLFCDFLRRWPTLKQAQQARKTTLSTFFAAHNVRYPKIIEQRLAAIRAATPLTQDSAVITPHRLLVEALVEQLRVTLQAIARFDVEIEATTEKLTDYPLFRALPGAGPAFAPRLLAAFGEQRERYTGAAELQKYAGIAPVTERSGKKSWVHWRLQCPKFLRQTFVEWAAASIPRSFWAAAYYQQQRDKGCSHQAAVRALAFKWIRILYRCWQTRTPYDESTYLNALKRRGSPILTSIVEIAKTT